MSFSPAAVVGELTAFSQITWQDLRATSRQEKEWERVEREGKEMEETEKRTEENTPHPPKKI